MFDTNQFVDKLLHISTFISRKREHFESFRKVEHYLKSYREKLVQLDRAAKDSSIGNFKNINDLLEEVLLEFNLKDLEDNTDTIESVIDFLKAHEKELKSTSILLVFINDTWKNFLNRKEFLEKADPNFVNQVNNEVEKINSVFIETSFDNLGRVESEAKKLKKEINEVVNAYDNFKVCLDKNVFIGERAKLVEYSLKNFLEIEFFEKTLSELSIRRKEIEELLEQVSIHETFTKTESFFVVRLNRKNSDNIHSYTIKAHGEVLDNQENINFDEYDIIETGQKVYFNNYPKEGIFERIELAENLKLSKKHLVAMAELETKAYKSFTALGVAFMFTAILSIFSVFSPFYLLPLLAISYFGFQKYFKWLKNSIDIEHNIPNSFYFIPIDYTICKEGDEGLNHEMLRITLLINDKKTFLREEKKHVKN